MYVYGLSLQRIQHTVTMKGGDGVPKQLVHFRQVLDTSLEKSDNLSEVSELQRALQGTKDTNLKRVGKLS